MNERFEEEFEIGFESGGNRKGYFCCGSEDCELGCDNVKRKDVLDFIQSEIDLANKEGQEQYKRFILNILDGHDQANIENGFATDTKSIRLAIQSRII